MVRRYPDEYPQTSHDERHDRSPLTVAEAGVIFVGLGLVVAFWIVVGQAVWALFP